jgi:hypothetical protein
VRIHRTLVLAVLALAACGGDEPATATREEFVAAADDVCAEHNQRIGDRYAEMTAEGTPVSEDAFNEFAGEYADSYEAMADDLGELPKPSDDAEVEQYMDRLARNAEALQDGDWSSDAFAQAHMNSMREANSLAEEVGFEECSPKDGF